MYVDSSTVRVKGNSYTRHLLRVSFREGSRVKHKTIANLSACSPEEINAIKLALRHKEDLASVLATSSAVSLRQGTSFGAVWVVYRLAQELGIIRALGPTREGKLALWQVIARVIDQGSRLSAVRLAKLHAACDILGLGGFNEGDLYANLDWLAKRQQQIENRLWARLVAAEGESLYLYDVTSSYLEGEHNELAAFGYNRDGKKGKRQIVIGLLCSARGVPLSIEVFVGNTQDPKTVASQVAKIAKRFGGGAVTLVGDRGMIKAPQIEALPEGLYYITAITKSQIESLLGGGQLQMSLFDETVSEVIGDGVRYVLRRNSVRAQEVAAQRQDKLTAAHRTAAKLSAYLAEHPRAQAEVALRNLAARIAVLRINAWAQATADGRVLRIEVDTEALAAAGKLDGCYAIKTNLPGTLASAQTVHDRYRDLALVEHGFRTAKTAELQLRPIYVRRATRTRGHVLVVMLAYRIVQELAGRWAALDLTVQEGLDHLAALSTHELHRPGQPPLQLIPQPCDTAQALLTAARVTLPVALPSRRPPVATKRTLPSRRSKH